MSFFNKVMASIGIGSAKVDTRVANPSVRVGEELKGIIQIKGGNVKQTIEKINLELVTEYLKEVDDKTVRAVATIETFAIANRIELEPEQSLELPFSLIIPRYTPVSAGKTKVWLKTSLGIDMALDPTDNDMLQIQPHSYMETALQALSSLGFSVRKVENLSSGFFRGALPFIQEFEFVPSGRYRSYLDELEAVFSLSDQGMEIFLEIDRKARGLGGFLAEMADMDETKVRVQLSTADLTQGASHVAGMLDRVISQYSR